MINQKLSELSQSELLKHYYKYPVSEGPTLELILLKHADLSCLKDLDKKIISDRIKKLTYSCAVKDSEVTVDRSGREEWEKQNPNCISRKEWERIAYKICRDYGITWEITDITKICTIAFDITRNIIPCEVLTAISIQQKACDLDLEIIRTAKECKLDYKILLEHYPSCDLNFKEYQILLKNKFNYDIIKTIYDSKLALEIDMNGNVILKSLTDRYYIPSHLKFKGIVVKEKGIKLVLKLIKDYKINDIDKQDIINGTTYI